ncbi:hypothetical protein ACEPPN_007291 [Leptodophora sp. 'Broadleaf-Isolate-01']
MPPSQWDHKADKDLLLAIIDEGALKGIVWPKIAVTLQSKGYTFTHEACRQHFQKIRKQSSSSTGPSTNGNGNGNGNTSSPSSPKKRPTPRKPSTPTASKSQTQTTGYGNNNDDEDDEDLPPPPSSKRKRIEKKEERVGSAGGRAGERGVYQFKIEQLGGAEHVDLEHDE